MMSIGKWIANLLADGVQPEEIGVFVRDQPQMQRAIKAVIHAQANPLS
jgi:hypothetical protein